MPKLKKHNGFNVEKIIQVLAYIQKKTDSTDKLKLMELLFFADRYHLREFSSFISSDIYYALRSGPVAYGTLNVINCYENCIYIDHEVVKMLDKIEVVDGTNRIIKERRTNCMHEVEMNVLDHICTVFGKFNTDELIEITHDYPEWKRYKDLFVNDLSDNELIVMDDFFKNPDIKESPALRKYFGGIDPLYKNIEDLNDVKNFLLR
jgi:uncharacterized phage-associated protein